jgi:argininosuccinate synthase
LRYDLDAFIETSQKVVNGKYKIKLYKGNMEIVHRESKTSLFSPEIRSIKATGFDQRRCADAAFVQGLPYEILARRKMK